MELSKGLCILDYCNTNNTAVVLSNEDCTDLSIDINEVVHQIERSQFDLLRVTTNAGSIDLFNKIKEQESVRFVIFLSKVEIPEDIKHLCLFISPFENKDCYIVTMEAILENLRQWCNHPYILFKQEKPAPLRGTDGYDTFTGETMRIRIPQIIHQTKDSIPSLTKQGQDAYSLLADQIRDDQPVVDMMKKDEMYDLLFKSQYNRALLQKQTWHSIPWWFAENYEFLCLNRIQEKTRTDGQAVDPFYYLKKKSLDSAMTVFPDLIRSLLIETRQTDHLTNTLFTKALLCILWGNKADLSMSGGKVNPSDIKSQSSNLLLVNEIDSVWNAFQSKEMKRMIVCADNVGLEILCDFALIAILLYFYPTLKIEYYIKENPVFVSDVTMADIQPTLDALEQSGEEQLIWMAQFLQQAQKEGRLQFTPSLFLCTALSGWEMPLSMVTALSQQDLMIAKGDANYRRLVGDLHWPYETAKEKVWSYYPCPMLLLRTLKSNVNVGIPVEKQEEARSFDSSWDCSGKVGIIQSFFPPHFSV